MFNLSNLFETALEISYFLWTIAILRTVQI
jgi:hypothetical protein